LSTAPVAVETEKDLAEAFTKVTEEGPTKDPVDETAGRPTNDPAENAEDVPFDDKESERFSEDAVLIPMLDWRLLMNSLAEHTNVKHFADGGERYTKLKEKRAAQAEIEERMNAAVNVELPSPRVDQRRRADIWETSTADRRKGTIWD
jgi:hypothetical protein